MLQNKYENLIDKPNKLKTYLIGSRYRSGTFWASLGSSLSMTLSNLAKRNSQQQVNNRLNTGWQAIAQAIYEKMKNI